MAWSDYASAADANATSNIQWISPTEYVDGSTLDVNDITGWRMSIGKNPSDYSVVMNLNADGTPGLNSRDVTITLAEQVSNGDVVQLYVAMQTVVGEDVSVFSNEVFKEWTVSIVAIEPGPPTSFQLNIDSVNCTAGPGLRCVLTPSQ